MRNDFAIFILTHGRPDAQHTLNSLLACGYTGKWYLVLDDQDETIQKYIDNYGPDNIIVFDKNHYINTTEVGSNNPPYKCIIYAKNAAEEMAKDMGLSAFVLADDDILDFRCRYIEDSHCKSMKIVSDFDCVCEIYVDLLLNSGMSALSFGFNSLYFVGADLYSAENVAKMRGAYNIVFRNASVPVEWKSAFGEDIVTEILHSHIGQLWCIAPNVQFNMVPLSSANGGMKDVYDRYKFKLLSYYLMYCPGSLIITEYKGTLKATVKINQAYPKIVCGRYKK